MNDLEIINKKSVKDQADAIIDQDSVIYYKSEIYKENSKKLIKMGFGLEKVNRALTMTDKDQNLSFERIIDKILINDKVSLPSIECKNNF